MPENPVRTKPQDDSLFQEKSDDWFRVVWDAMNEDERERVRAKCRWEQMSLRAVLTDWPTLAPPGVWHLIPKPDRRP